MERKNNTTKLEQHVQQGQQLQLQNAMDWKVQAQKLFNEQKFVDDYTKSELENIKNVCTTRAFRYIKTRINDRLDTLQLKENIKALQKTVAENSKTQAENSKNIKFLIQQQATNSENIKHIDQQLSRSVPLWLKFFRGAAAVLGSILAITSGVVLVVNSAEDAVKWGIETIVVAGVQTVLEAVNKFSEEKYKSIEKKIGEE